MGSGDQYASFGAQRAGFTDPAAVEYFVQETCVDMLAIAFGNAHGVYKGDPCLDLELVSEIRRRVEVPLVMHGGSGISDEQFRAAVTAGISKINFATNIMNAARENMRAAGAKPNSSMFEMLDGVNVAYREWCAKLFDIFGTTGRASQEWILVHLARAYARPDAPQLLLFRYRIGYWLPDVQAGVAPGDGAGPHQPRMPKTMMMPSMVQYAPGCRTPTSARRRRPCRAGI